MSAQVISARFRVRGVTSGDNAPGDHLWREIAVAETGHSFWYGYGDISGAASESHLIFRSDGTRLWHDIVGAEDGSTEFVGDGSALTGLSYRHVQSAPAAIWTVDHNLGRRPDVIAYNSDGEKITGAVAAPSLSRITITFSEALSGEARCT